MNQETHHKNNFKVSHSPALQPQGILLVDKPRGKTSFWLVAALRKRFNVKTIGHAGTLDPFATGVMVMLIGKPFTKLSNQYLTDDKEYTAKMLLGVSTDTYDCEGLEITRSDIVPSQEDIATALAKFQGQVEQIPPMFSAKKVQGQKLYELARQGKEIERKPVLVTMEVIVLEYAYPYLTIHVKCSKGTYVRSIAHDLGAMLGCGAHLVELQRTRSGNFSIDQCVDGTQLFSPDILLESRLLQQ